MHRPSGASGRSGTVLFGQAFDVEGNEILAGNEDGLRRIVDPNISVRIELTDSNGDGIADDPDCPQLDGGRCGLRQRVSYDPNFAGSSWVDAQPSVDLTLPVVSGLRSIYVQLRDPAGNVSTTAEVQVNLNVELDLEGPQIPGLSRHFIGVDKIRLQVTRPPDDDLSYYVVERNVPDIDGANWNIVELTPAIADDRMRRPMELPQA